MTDKKAFGPFLLSLSQIKPHLLTPDISEAEIINYIKELSVQFTVKRKDIDEYTTNEKKISAYTSFYLPTNIPKLEFLLSRIPEKILEDLKHRPFIDMGCGPGTFSLAYKKIMNIDDFVEITAVDSSELMLKQAKKIMAAFYPETKFNAQKKYINKKSESILFFGHSINEMGIEKASDIIATIDPEYILWIEPGTSEAFFQLKKMREVLLSTYNVIYPCPGDALCPNEWCHQVLRTSHEASIERLSQIAALDRRTLPMSTHFYRRKNSEKKESLPVTTRFLNETKFSFEYEICREDENKNNSNEVIQLLKKELSKAEIKFFKSANVGELLDLLFLKKLETSPQKKWRVTLNKKT